MKVLSTQFDDRQALIEHVKRLAPWAGGEVSVISGGYTQAHRRLEAIDPVVYAKTRNFAEGNVTMLSPFVHHGVISLNEIRNYALQKCAQPEQATKFIQELAWRDFWQRVAEMHPEWIWNDVEPYKTGYQAQSYAETLPEDILTAHTGVACIDTFIRLLLDTGYVHNHARMYLASYVVHFRRVKWQAGAQWFLEHLLDGDEASNNFSWQWVASTFSNKPYVFNLDNVNKYFSEVVETEAANNAVLNYSYEQLAKNLFPEIGSHNG